MNKDSSLNILSIPPATDVDTTINASRKTQISHYEGEGIEGLPYYDILSK